MTEDLPSAIQQLRQLLAVHLPAEKFIEADRLLLRAFQDVRDDQRSTTLNEAASIGEDITILLHDGGDDHRARGAWRVVDALRRKAEEK